MKEEGNEGDEESAKLWNFRELCSWKLPEHLSTTGVKSLNRLNNRIHTDANLQNTINLYKLGNYL